MTNSYLADIIIPSYNNVDEALRCLEGFNEQTEKNFNLFLCVDGSTDRTIEAVKERDWSFPLRILEPADKKNHGRNAARNLALPYLSSEYTILLDSDLIPDKRFVENHLSCLREGKCVSVGKIIYINAGENWWGDYLMSRGHHRFTPQREMPFYYFLTGNSALKTQWILELNGFDESLKTYGGNDLEISWRIKERYSPKTIYNNLAVARGTMNKSLSFALEQMSEFGAINLPYIRKKHPEFDQMFRFYRLISDSLWAKALWWNGWEKLISISIKMAFSPLRRKMIHYLTAKYLRVGFKKGTKIKATLFDKLT